MKSNLNLVILVLTLTMLEYPCSNIEQSYNNKGQWIHHIQILNPCLWGLKIKMNIIKSTSTRNGMSDYSRMFNTEDFFYTGTGGVSRRRQKMSRLLVVMLMAYTLKFIFLIPTMIGGLILLKFTTLLAGFFYSLFAATLGLKAQRSINY